jgi:hypothetical protein
VGGGSATTWNAQVSDATMPSPLVTVTVYTPWTRRDRGQDRWRSTPRWWRLPRCRSECPADHSWSAGCWVSP